MSHQSAALFRGQDNPTPLTEREIALVKRLFSDPFSFPPEVIAWIKGQLEADPPLLTSAAVAGTFAPKTASVIDSSVADGAAIQVSKLQPGTDTFVIQTVAGVPTWQPAGTGSGAPSNAEYLTAVTNGLLTAERVLSGNAGEVTVDYSGAGAAVVKLTPHLAAANPHPQYAPLATPIATKSAAYAMAATDDTILANATGGGFTVTLPPPVAGKTVTVKKIDSSGNAVTVGRNSADVIDGALSKALPTQWSVVSLISNGTDWFLV